ncbi:hypothetical protein GF325_16260 [Candidatus Bathyarchaeota archaeon]|nr:hypothetical protein [Candidatus Bathyarchaeota archaeon]
MQSPDTVVDFEDYFTGYETLYSFLVFFFSFITSFIITPTWFFDDINLMFYRVEENVKFLYPYGRSVLPWLKGLGGPGVIISYILFIIVRIGIDIKFIIIIIDPLITFYIPIMFLMGYESISFAGKKILKRWLQKKGIEEFTDLELILTKQVGKSAQSSYKDPKRIQQDPA